MMKGFESIDSNHDGYLAINEILEGPERVADLVHFRQPPPVNSN